ncbi:MAG: hypothetical protein FWG53_03110 [Clostridiales bacterium]|nr:hypothetical protein [Clostridiales bacterium]
MIIKKTLILALACMLAFALLAGCHSGGGDNDDGDGDWSMAEGDLTAEDLVAKSAETMTGFANCKAALSMEMDINSIGRDDEVINAVRKVDVETDVFKSPLKIKMTLSMDSQKEGYRESSFYVFPEGSSLATYSDMMGLWYKTVQPPGGELLAQYDMTQSCKVLSDAVKQAEIVAQETVDGKNCWKINVVVSGTSVMDMLLCNRGGQEIARYLPASVIEDIEDVNAALWVSKKGCYQVKTEMDLTSAMATLMKDTDMKTNNLKISMAFGYGEATDFKLPKEADNATELNTNP